MINTDICEHYMLRSCDNQGNYQCDNQHCKGCLKIINIKSALKLKRIVEESADFYDGRYSEVIGRLCKKMLEDAEK